MRWRARVAVLLMLFSSSSFGADRPLDEACNEYLEIKNNLTGFFTTSLREAAQSGYCAGTYHALVESSTHFRFSCRIPASSEDFAQEVVSAKLVSVHQAIKAFCPESFVRW